MARAIKKHNIDRILHHPSILKGILIMAIPVFLNNFLKSLHDMVDAIFVARMPVDSQATLDAALTALNIHWPVYFLFMAFGTGLGIATVAMVSQYVGAGKKELATAYASKLFMMAMMVSLVAIAIFFFTSDLVVGFNVFAYLMGARGEALDFAGSYFRIRSFDLFFVFMFMVYQAIRQSTGETLYPVILNMGSIVLNMLLTWLFVSRLNMGIDGAAYATLIAHASVTPLIMFDLLTSKRHLRLSIPDMKLSLAVIKDMSRFALPAATGQALNSVGFIIIQSIILFYGNDVSAGFSVGNRIAMLLLNPVVAISTVLAAFVGLNVGHNQPNRAKDSFRVAAWMAVVLMTVGIAIIIPLRGPIIELILNTRVSSSYRIAYEYSVWILLTQPFFGLYQIHVGLFNGSGHPKLTMKMGLVRLWGIRIPLLLALMYLLSPDDYSGVWHAMVISNILILFYAYHLKKQINYEVRVTI